MRKNKNYRPADLSKIKTYSAKLRPTKSEINDFASASKKDLSFKEFYDKLPKFLAVKNLKAIVDSIIEANKNNRLNVSLFSRTSITVYDLIIE